LWRSIRIDCRVNVLLPHAIIKKIKGAPDTIAAALSPAGPERMAWSTVATVNAAGGRRKAQRAPSEQRAKALKPKGKTVHEGLFSGFTGPSGIAQRPLRREHVRRCQEAKRPHATNMQCHA
jgi:hypothetical protein